MTINLNEQLSLGEFFRQMRVGQHVTLKQAAGSWSSSALSRFERGETDISVDRALDVMHNLGMGAGRYHVLATDAARSVATRPVDGDHVWRQPAHHCYA
jgi:transcriptional regulator with XRE-family HTH domain